MSRFTIYDLRFTRWSAGFRPGAFAITWRELRQERGIYAASTPGSPVTSGFDLTLPVFRTVKRHKCRAPRPRSIHRVIDVRTA